MKIDILGVKINTEPKAEILRGIASRLNRGEKTFIATPYSEFIVRAQKDQELKDIINNADYALPDGVGIIFAAQILAPRAERQARFKRIIGREFFFDLCALAAERGESIFLLGGFGSTTELAAAKLKKKFPNLKVVGLASPNRAELESEGSRALVERINGSQATYLFAALGPFVQERWIQGNLPRLNVKVAMGVGGTFDYIAGKYPLPPRIMQATGLEWLWRLTTQPWRAIRIARGVLGLIWLILTKRDGKGKL